ncbi:hypothetical protein MGG_16476 [Pyricularia oryzae 70-15]|uniref:Secreted protein n=3 Tax=Pyricularia oryzae TaxID=318829 RepID=G4MQC1_PYRO7|nr:uncharacterized protein MGG_16476 [Pyricularia oryzae 70-15]EHA58107.1 hypothetical protein MGG_16476 [Pyricularia oryzae 70-15]ELQ39436.1 hypothetical protein OOU_Y34scaffold00498g19 [Pyricularia oryzae Y34]KAI7915163.1 hypothetical protein M9X92_008566 [Pyricularia oryzae]KAI7917382.1 hypothetical protein M0657_008135 [Pyricularia oryzae]
MKFTSALAIAAMYMAGPTLGAKLRPTNGHGAPDACLGVMYKKSEGVKGPSAARFATYPGGSGTVKHGVTRISVGVTEDCGLRGTPGNTPVGYGYEIKPMAWSDKPSRDVAVERVRAINDLMFVRRHKPEESDSRFRGFDENGKMLPLPSVEIRVTCRFHIEVDVEVFECDD